MPVCKPCGDGPRMRYSCEDQSIITEDADFEVLETKFSTQSTKYKPGNTGNDIDNIADYYRVAVGVERNNLYCDIDTYEVFDAIAEDAEEAGESLTELFKSISEEEAERIKEKNDEPDPLVLCWDFNTGRVTTSFDVWNVPKEIKPEAGHVENDGTECDEKRGNIRGLFFVPNNAFFVPTDINNVLNQDNTKHLE